jgi:hypothetical protein
MTLAEDQTSEVSGDALDIALRDPEVRASLAVIAANAPEIAVMMSASSGLLARSREIMDNVNGMVIKVRESTGSSDPEANVFNLVHVLSESAPAIERLLSSPILQPDVVEVIGSLGQAASDAKEATQSQKAEIRGVFSLMRELKDPEVAETLAFLLAFARSFGNSQSVKGGSK